MRKLIAFMVLVLLGTVAGSTLAVLEYEGLPRSGLSLAEPRWTEAQSKKPDPNAKIPRALVESTEFEFGTIERGTSRSHEFEVTNVGTAPLELKLAGTSCVCTVSGLDTDMLPPGKTARVKLEWKTNEQSLEWFRQTADIETNDPETPKIEFVVRGQVIDTVELEPRIVTIDKLLDETKTTEAIVRSRTAADLQITGHQLLDADTADKFAVDYQSVTPNSSDFKSQWSLKVTVKPGLPLGPFEQRIRLETNSPARPEITLVVTGKVGSDLQVRGPGWNDRLGSLTLGTVDPDESRSEEIKVIVRGPHREQVRIQVKKKVPEFLDVQIGETQRLSGGEVLHIPVKITVPRGAPASHYLGGVNSPFGEVVLETGHPDQPELLLKVSFAVGR